MAVLEFFNTNILYGLIILITLLYFILTRIKHKNHNYPPGPKGYPLVGYLKFLSDHPDHVVEELSKDYEHVFMFPVGNDDIVVLNSLQAIKDAYVRNANFMTGTIARHKTFNYIFDCKGVISEEGESWREQRKFAINVMREFGVGKITLEDKILQECEAMIEEVRKKDGKPFYAMPILANAVANIICTITFGKRFQYNDPTYQLLIKLSEEFDVAVIQVSYLDSFRFLHYLPEKISGLANARRIKDGLKTYIWEQIEDHKNTYNENNLRDYMDYGLREIYKQNDIGQTENSVHDVHRLCINAISFFVAGSVSIAMTMIWALKFLVVYPEIQKKVLDEIDRVVGRDRHPSWMDKPNTPYIEAFFNEVLRVSDLVPIGVPRANIEAIQVMGYDIPKRSVVYCNFHKIHNDPQIWGDPENFKPEHFLDSKTGKVINGEYVFTFGTGKRICLGENLARMEMYLLLITLLQNFTFYSSENEGDKSSFNVIEGIVRYLKPFNISAKPRIG